MSEQTFKYGLAARRYLVLKGLGMMGEASIMLGQDRVFLQAYRWAHAHAMPSLKRCSGVLEEVDRLRGPEDLEEPRYAGVRHVKWGKVAWWMEAWYRDGVFGADPKGEGVSGEELLRDDPNQASHFYAERAYRRAVVTANDTLAEVVRERDAGRANALYDSVYPYLVAVAFPVLERLEGVQRDLEELWGDGVPESESKARRLRLDTIGVLVDAWTRSAVLAQPSVPRDTTSRDDILRHLQNE